jgi:membrane protease YdiL (CAAX protease family)
MATIKAFVKRHPVLTYCALTFAISWGGFVLLIAGRTGILATTEQAASLLPAVFLVTVAGPTVASVLLTGLVYGKGGYRQLLSRLLRWRVDARSWAVALLTGALLATATLLALSLTSPVFLPAIVTSDEKASLLLRAIAVGLMVGFLEELGWTGFAVPGVRPRYSVLATGLVVGFLWGVWHVPSQVWASGDASGALSLSLLVAQLVFALAVLPAFRVLMVWVHDHTQSLLVAMLMYGSLVAALLAMTPVGIAGATMLIWYLAVAVAVWVVVAVAVANRGRLSRHRAAGATPQGMAA